MAAISTVRSGNWSDTSGTTPWDSLTGSGAGGVPGDGDTVTIATGHTVTLDGNNTIGTSPAGATTWQLDVVGTGKVDLATYTLTVKGSIRLGDGTAALPDRIVGSAGSKLYIDGSATPATTYQIQFGSATLVYYSRSGINLTGTSGNRCELKVTGGSAKMLGAELYRARSLHLTYTDISGFGSATVNGVTIDSNYTTGDTDTSSGVYLVNCNISACGSWNITARATSPRITDTKWTGSLQNLANGYKSLLISGLLSTSYAVIQRCSFDRQLNISGTSAANITISDLLCRGSLWMSPTVPPTSGVNNILHYIDSATDTAISTATSLKLNGNWTNVYLLVDFSDSGTSGNPHQMNIYNAGQTFTVDTVVSDFRGVRYNVDTGDTLDAFGLTVSSTIKNALILPAVYSDGASQKDASGALWWGSGTANAKLNIEHCTVYSPVGTTGVNFPHGTSNAANTGAVRSCLFWSDAAATGTNYAVQYDYSVNTNDVLALADGLQNNAHWNMSTGTNTVNSTPTNYVGYNGIQWSTAPTLTDITLAASPNFVDSTRNFWTWASTVLGLTGTDAQLRDGAIAAIEADRTLLVAADTGLIPWVRAGFAPRNTSLKNAGHDGVTIGAVEGSFASSSVAPQTLSLSLGLSL